MEDKGKLAFLFFNEIGIINQLASALFNKKLPDGLHVSHFSVLNHMMRMGDGRTPATLASAMQVTKATMTHTLSALAKRDLIVIEPHASDGRSKVVRLTPAGRTFHAEAIGSLFPAIAALDEAVDWESLENLIPELQRVRAILDNNRDL